MSDTHTTAPNPLAVAAVRVYGPRLALERMAQHVEQAQLHHRGAVASVHDVRDPDARRWMERHVAETRGSLMAAIDMLTEVVALVAPLLPEGE